jgi:uncharacterized protein (TIGR03067 family)
MKINFSFRKINIAIRSLAKICFCLFSLLLAATAYTAELSGTWEGTDNTGEPYTIVFTATDWSITHDSGGDWQKGTYTANDNTNPKQLDLYITGSSDNEFISKIALFIYKIDGNTLTLTGSEPGDSYRPLEFSEGNETRTFIVTDEDRDTDEKPDNAEHSDDDDKVKVYINCFVDLIME